MHGSGARGVLRSALVALVVAAFVGCGGSSKSRGSDADDGGESGSSSSGASTAGTSGSAGTTAGTSGAQGGSSNPNGGSGAATPIPPPGPVFCNGQPCDAPLACCMATGECFDPDADDAACNPPPPDGDPEGRRTCASNQHCETGEFCMLDGQLCIGTGHCQPIDNCGTCSGCRVCGCDGNTYPDIQTACRAGANAVGASRAGCGEPQTEGGAGASTIGTREFIPCGHDGNCPSGSFCCAMAARCYLEADRDICIPPPDGTRIACRTTENCGDGEYCLGEGCDGPGGCVRYGSKGDCGVTFEPVCGCDGTTYTSVECAASRGVRVDHSGECSGGE